MSTETLAKEAFQEQFCSIPFPKLVYVGPRTRSEFDRLELEETVGDWEYSEVRSLLKADGNKWEFRIRAKTVGNLGDGMKVVFQWYEHRIVGSFE